MGGDPGVLPRNAGQGGKGVGITMAEESRNEPVSLEVLSVGPLFREVDYRHLETEARGLPFRKKSPLCSFHG